MKRRIAIVLFFLLLGVIVNIAVAWGCVYRHMLESNMKPSLGAVRVSLAMSRNVDFQPLLSEEWERFPGQYPAVRVAFGVHWKREDYSGRHVDADPTVYDPGFGRAYGWVERGHLYTTVAGWPFSALDGSCWIQGDSHLDRFTTIPNVSRDEIRGGISVVPLLTWFMTGHGMEPRIVIPLRPIWPGIAINTFIYALLLWLLFAAPFTARRIIQERKNRRRGRCEKCAYPIGVSPVCTECGAPVPRRVEA